MADMLSTLGPLIGVLVTAGFWSYLYKENAFFRLVEFTFVGFAAAHATVMAIQGIQSQLLSPMISKNNYSLIIPLILGLLLYTRYFKEIKFFERFPISLMVGVGTGIAVRAMVKAQLIAQVQKTINPSFRT